MEWRAMTCGSGLTACAVRLSEEFANASGQYYDNDARRIARPHPAAADRAHVAQLMAAIRELAGA